MYKRTTIFVIISLLLFLLGCNSKVNDFKKVQVVVLSDYKEPRAIMSVEEFAKIYVSALEFAVTEKDFKWEVQKVRDKGERVKSNQYYLLTYYSDRHIIEFPICVNKEKNISFCLGDEIKADRPDKLEVILYAPFIPAVF